MLMYLEMSRNTVIDKKYIELNSTALKIVQNLKQGAHLHRPTAGPAHHACAQPYHAGSGSHRQLVRPY